MIFSDSVTIGSVDSESSKGKQVNTEGRLNRQQFDASESVIDAGSSQAQGLPMYAKESQFSSSRASVNGDSYQYYPDKWLFFRLTTVWEALLCLAMPALLALNALAVPQFATGTRDLTDQERALVSRFAHPIESVRDLTGSRRLLSAPPPKVTNYRYLPTVYCQQLNDCGAFAPSYYLKTYQEAREHGWLRPDPAVDPEHVMSPGFTFPLSNGGQDDGAAPSYVMSLICRYGIASWKDMPENRNDWYTYPTESVWRRAAAYRGDRVLTFNGRTDEGLAAIKEYLASGELLVLSLYIYHDVYDSYPNGACVNSEVICANGTVNWDSHSFTLIGYDDTKTYSVGGIQRTGAFLAVNSWGTGWGVTNELVGSGGCVWFGYDYIKSESKVLGVCGMTDRIGYQPTDFLVMDIQHARACDLTVQVKAGPAAGGGWLEAFPNSAAIQPFSGRIVADVTDFAVEDPLAYWLRVEDGFVEGWKAALGQITRAWVERGTNLILPAAELPLMTVDDVVFQIPIGAFQQTPLYGDGTTLEHHFGAWADVDQDGDLDLIAAGYVTGQSTNFTRLYRNDHGVFREEDVGLPGGASVGVGAMAFGDYDGDSYPDLLMSYYDPAARVGKTRLFRNQAGKSFVDSGIGLPGLTSAAVAWGDYDNDGDVDLLLAGLAPGSVHRGYLLRNDRTNFVDTGIILGGVGGAPVSWVDFNNDGLLDCMVAETLYRHYPDGTFQVCPSSNWLYGGRRGAHAWGDYNGDGLPDLATCMIRDDGSQPRIVTRIYRNDGETFYPSFEPWPPGPRVPESYAVNFTVVATNLPGVYGGNLQWADMDNDGRLDLVICGGATDSSDGGGQTLILRQQADGTFTDIGAGLAGFTDGFITAVDADTDGALDLFAAGSSWPSLEPPPVLGVYQSVLASQAYGPWASNAPPGVPASRYAWSAPTGYVHLSWSAPLDDHTPSPSLTYRMRVGTRPGACDIVSAAHGVIGVTHGQHAGLSGATPPAYVPVRNTNTSPGLRLHGLAPGRYYWSVQAVDGSQAASPWSEEQSFTAGPAGLRDGDVNQDGVVDIADLVLCRHMLQGRASTNLETSDLDGNGRLEENDLRLLAAQLLGLSGTTNCLPLTQTQIGLAGGRVAAGGFEMVVPSGTFRSNALVSVSYSYDNRPPGWQSNVPLFHISGVPTSLGGSLIIRMPDTRSSPTGEIELAIGQMTPSREDPEILERAFTSVTGTQDPDGWLRFEVPPSLLFGAETQSGLRFANLHAAASNGGTGWQDDWRIDFDACLLEDWTALLTRHFKIYWQAGGLGTDQLYALGNELEQAYSLFESYGFESARDMAKNRVKVWVIDTNDEGECVYLTAASAYLNMRKKTVQENAEMRATTVCHEFFHLVQGLISPNSAFSQAFDDHLKLLNEATAVWSESLMASSPVDYVPELYIKYRERLFDGYSHSAKLSTSSQSGYGFSALIDFLSRRHPGIVTNVYNDIRAGSDAVDALLNNVPVTDTAWHDDFYRDFILGKIYPSRPLVLFSGSALKPEWPNDALVVDIATAANRQKTWVPFIAGLGAEAYQVTFATNQMASLTNGEALAFALHNPITQDEKLHVFTAVLRTEPDGTFPVTDYSSEPGTRRCLLTNLHRVFELKPKGPMRSVLGLVVRSNLGQPDEFGVNIQPLNVGVVYQLNGSSNLLSQTVFNNNYYNLAFPQFQCSGSVDLNNCIGTYSNRVSIDSDKNTAQVAHLVLWQDGAIAIPVTFNANPIALTTSSGAAAWGTNCYTISNIRYQLTKRNLAPPNNIISTEYPGNSFSLGLDANEDQVYYHLQVKFQATWEQINDAGQVTFTTTSTNMGTHLLTAYLTRR